MLNSKGKRELAFIARVTEVNPIPNATSVEIVHVGGWRCMVRKGMFHVGSLGVLFEIDSKLPANNEAFEFMSKYHYHVKAQKYFKGTVISDALFLAAEDLGWSLVSNEDGSCVIIDDKGYERTDADETRFVTNILGVTYYDPADNARKSNGDPNAKYKAMAGRHPKLFKNPIIRKIYRTNFGKKLLYLFFGKKRDSGTPWPAWVSKTDEERVQNLGSLYNEYQKENWIATEKIDGTSTTFTMKRGKKKNEFYVCSRNVVMTTPDRKNFYSETSGNVYWKMAIKYNIEKALTDILNRYPDIEWVTIQGETYGNKIQNRNYGLNDIDFVAFNFITSNTGRWSSMTGSLMLSAYGIPWVPIVDANFKLPATTDELLSIATGESAIDGGMREGLVLRSFDGKKSFKAVSPEFLLKFHS